MLPSISTGLWRKAASVGWAGGLPPCDPPATSREPASQHREGRALTARRQGNQAALSGRVKSMVSASWEPRTPVAEAGSRAGGPLLRSGTRRPPVASGARECSCAVSITDACPEFQKVRRWGEAKLLRPGSGQVSPAPSASSGCERLSQPGGGASAPGSSAKLGHAGQTRLGGPGGGEPGGPGTGLRRESGPSLGTPIH